MDYIESLEYLKTLPKFPTHAGLDRIRSVLSVLGNPEKGMRFIHVAGTNGKGSTCVMLSSVLTAAGYKTGLYISPYIICFRERIEINGEYISESDFASLATRVRETGIEVTEFEFITAVAFLYYKYKECDVVVLETGLGGRFDATNVIENPLASVITGIGLDHTAVLGETVEQIAGEKCGIIKPGAKVLTTYNQNPFALEVIKGYKNPIIPDKNQLEIIESSLSGNRFIYKGIEYKTKLLGEYQIENALLAIEAAGVLGLPIDTASVVRGIAEASFPARMELLSENPIVILDGAHNPHGAAALAETLKNYKGGTAIIGMMADKNCDEVLSILLPLVSRVIAVPVNNPRSLPPKTLAQMAKPYCSSVAVASDIDDALALTAGDEKIFIFGSLYLASEIREKAKEFYS